MAEELADALTGAIDHALGQRVPLFLATVVSEAGGLVTIQRLDAATPDDQAYPKLIGNQPGVALTAADVVLMGGVDPTRPLVLGRVSHAATSAPAATPMVFSGRQNVDSTHGATVHLRLPAAASVVTLWLYGQLPAPYRQRSHNHTATFGGSGHSHSASFTGSSHGHTGSVSLSGHDHTASFTGSSHDHPGSSYSGSSHSHTASYTGTSHNHGYQSGTAGFATSDSTTQGGSVTVDSATQGGSVSVSGNTQGGSVSVNTASVTGSVTVDDAPSVSGSVTVDSGIETGAVTVTALSAEAENRPSGVSVAIDGVDRTGALGGTFGASGSDWSAGPLDITSYAGASGAHTLALTATGHGLIEWAVYAYL